MGPRTAYFAAVDPDLWQEKYIVLTVADWVKFLWQGVPLVCDHSNESYFHVVLFIMLYKVGLTFKSVDETLVCDHLNESYWAVLSCGIVYYAVQGGSNF